MIKEMKFAHVYDNLYSTPSGLRFTWYDLAKILNPFRGSLNARYALKYSILDIQLTFPVLCLKQKPENIFGVRQVALHSFEERVLMIDFVYFHFSLGKKSPTWKSERGSLNARYALEYSILDIQLTFRVLCLKQKPENIFGVRQVALHSFEEHVS
jgi:hypothetical protein